jgi:nucleotide-binding universal stress UspA family protein
VSVVAGYVPNPLGRDVVRAAADEAKLRATRLVIVNSATGAAYADAGLASDEELRALAASAEALGVQVEVRQATHALSAAETLLEEVASSQASLLVIGLRSRTRAGKFLLGSTAQTLLLQARCPVLAIKASDTAP